MDLATCQYRFYPSANYDSHSDGSWELQSPSKDEKALSCLLNGMKETWSKPEIFCKMCLSGGSFFTTFFQQVGLISISNYFITIEHLSMYFSGATVLSAVLQIINYISSTCSCRYPKLIDTVSFVFNVVKVILFFVKIKIFIVGVVVTLIFKCIKHSLLCLKALCRIKKDFEDNCRFAGEETGVLFGCKVRLITMQKMYLAFDIVAQLIVICFGLSSLVALFVPGLFWAPFISAGLIFFNFCVLQVIIVCIKRSIERSLNRSCYSFIMEPINKKPNLLVNV